MKDRNDSANWAQRSFFGDLLDMESVRSALRSPFSPAVRISGPDPERQSYRSYVSFEDPDGNAWIVPESRVGCPATQLDEERIATSTPESEAGVLVVRNRCR